MLCTVEGTGISALRTLTSTDGSVIFERLYTLDETAHSLSYAAFTLQLQIIVANPFKK